MKHELTSQSLKLTIEFIKDFIKYWELIKFRIQTHSGNVISWKKWDSLSRSLLSTATKSFYVKWEKIGFLEWIEPYIEAFSSFYFRFQNSGFLIPKQLILYESTVPNNSLLATLKENPSIDAFERTLFDLASDLNIKLHSSSVRIIRKLSQSSFSKSLDKFPKNKELAYGTRQDVRTVSSSLEFLFSHNILSLIYQVDMARLGYLSELLIHNKNSKEIPQSVKKFFTLSFPILNSKKIFTVIRYPYRDTEAFKEIFNLINPEKTIILNTQYQGWNLGGLTNTPVSRWINRPPLLQPGGKWNDKLIISNQGIIYNLNPLFDPFLLTKRQIKLLALVNSKSSMNESALEKELGASRSYIKEDWLYLLRNKLINRFPIFSHIGLGAVIYFVIFVKKNLDVITNILPHLKMFPYVNLFYETDTGVIIGKIKLPQNWVHSFLFRLASLRLEFNNSESNYYIGPEAYAPWGFDILNTYNWQD